MTTSRQVHWGIGIALALASGGLTALAFPPFRSSEAALIAIVPLIVCARLFPPRLGFRFGGLSGFCFWLITSAWLLAMHSAGGPLALVVLAWVGLSAYCALYVGLFVSLASVLWHGWTWLGETPNPDVDRDGMVPNIVRLFALPLIWVGCEYLRATLFSGFAWNALGVSQYSNLAAIQGAAWGGVYAVSALCMIMNACLALTAISVVARILNRHLGRRVHPELMIGLMIWGGMVMLGYKQCRALDEDGSGDTQSLRIAAIQSNIAQDDKWQSVTSDDILQTLYDLTSTAKLSAPELIIWPETAVPRPADSDPVIRTFVSELAGPESEILVGTIEARQESGDDDYTFHNSAILFDGDGPRWPFYRKLHLVPFGEYIPGEQIIPSLARLSPIGYSCAAGQTNTVFRLKASNISFSALICFEDTIAGLARRAVQNGAQFLVNMTNDAWFEGSWAGWQHMTHCVFRCVENRVPAVRCANLGVSCYIDRAGRIDVTTRDALSRERSVDVDYRLDELTVRPQGTTQTVYNRYGDLPFALPCGTFCVLAFFFIMGRHRRDVMLARKQTLKKPGDDVPQDAAPTETHDD